MNTTRRSFLQKVAAALGAASLIRCAQPLPAKDDDVQEVSIGGVKYQASGVFIDGPAFVWGVPEKIRPICNLPPGARGRFKFGHDREARAFVSTAHGIEAWSLDDHGDHWMLGSLMYQGARVGGQKEGPQFLTNDNPIP